MFDRSRQKSTARRHAPTIAPAGLIFWKPRTPGTRHKITIDYESLGVYTGPPVPGLSSRVGNTGGRNELGRITVRGRGGGADKIVRSVDYVRQGAGSQSCVVERIEADPNRSGFLALARYDSGGLTGRCWAVSMFLLFCSSRMPCLPSQKVSVLS